MFEELSRKAGPDPVGGPMEKMGRIMLRASVEEQTFSLDGADLAEVDDAENLLAMSIEFEQDTVAFYEMMRPFLRDPEAAETLDRIVEEERLHIEKLGAMKAKLTAVEKDPRR